MAGNVSSPGTSVTSRVLSVLGCFDARHPTLRLSEIARGSDLPLSTAHRLVGELVTWGALSRLDDGSYAIGRRLWRLGLLAPASSTLREAAAPFLHDIHAATRATVHLGVRDGITVLYLERLSGSVSVPVVSRVGSRLPLHATGVGKVLLAYAPAEVQTAATPSTSPSGTGSAPSTSSGSPGASRCPSSARWAAACRCTRPASARCCSRTPRPRCRRRH